MSTVAITVALIVGAGLTFSLWGFLMMIVPGFVVGNVMHDPEAQSMVMAVTMKLMTVLVVFAFGTLVLPLPWLAALIAGIVLAVTTSSGGWRNLSPA